MVCFDTDFLITLIKEDATAVKKLEDLIARGQAPGNTTVVNAVELYRGAFRSKNSKNEINKVERILEMFNLLGIDQNAAKLIGEVDAATKSNTIGDLDLLIAGIALANKQTLITRNVKHFERVPGLAVESW